ncbi:AAA family ATPase [Cupriavidus basilensis]
MQGGGKGGAFSFDKSRARLIDENQNAVTFQDVAGCDESKEEVVELVDFLKDPRNSRSWAAVSRAACCWSALRAPSKTLLARAIAGEAKVPFFSISGSDFVEMFVGAGAAVCARHVRERQEAGALHRLH